MNVTDDVICCLFVVVFLSGYFVLINVMLFGYFRVVVFNFFKCKDFF